MKKWVWLLIIFLQASCSNNSINTDTYGGRVAGQASESLKERDLNKYDAVVSSEKISTSAPLFTSLQAAINAAPDNNTKPFRIYVAKGIYQEKITVAKNNLHIIGAGPQQTRISFGDYAGKTIAGDRILSTPGSASVTVTASDVQIQNLTIENTFDFLANDALANDNPKKINGSQAVALYLASPSDRVLVRNVTLLGYQDTLFVDSGRSWFNRVLVAGNVDFVFGKGNALFTDSEIKTLARAKPGNPHGYITAPSTQLKSPYGFTFINCRITRDLSVPDKSVPLGRPWHPTTQFSDGRYADPNAIGKSVFINSWMDAHITGNGWYSMGGSTKEGGRKNFQPEDARFFEYKNSGPGAEKNEKRRQLDDAEVANYTREKILGDWNIR